MCLRLTLFLTCLLAFPLPHRALAEDTQDRAQAARALFEEGLRHVDAQAWSEAEAKFRQALALRDSPVIRYNLAVTLVELRQLVEARQLLESIERDATTTPTVREKLPELLEQVTRRAVRLTVRLQGDAERAEVTVDDRTLRPDELGQELLLDPGKHIVRVRRDGAAIEERQVQLAEGAAQVVVLTLPERPGVPSPAEVAFQAAAPTPVPRLVYDDRDSVRRRRLWWGLGTAGAVVAAAVVTGIIVASRARGQSPSYEGDFDPPVIGVEVPR